MKMPGFLIRRGFLRRIGYSLLVLFGLSILIFMIARVVPGDPATMALGPRATEEAKQRLREELHLNDPYHIQYYYWLKNALHGDLGRAIVTRRSITTDIMEFFPASLELILFSAVIDVVLAISLGVLAGRYANTWIDNVVRVISYIGIAIPSFVVAIISMVIFGQVLNIMPTMGRLSPEIIPPPTVTGMVTLDSLIGGRFDAFVNVLWHLILPGFALALGSIAQEARITRSGMIENSNKEYIVLATSHGIPEKSIMFKYLLKPSIIPTVSIMALDIASMISNAFIVEMIFVWPGFSRYGINAMLNKDLNAIVSVVIIIGLIYTTVNLVVDLLVAHLDPRIGLAEMAE